MHQLYKTNKIILLAIVGVLLHTSFAFGQFNFLSEEIRYSLHAETSVLFSTIKGDYNKRELKPSYKGGPSFGCYLSVALNDEFAVEPGAFLAMRGSKTKIDNITQIGTEGANIYINERGLDERELYYFTLPVLVQYRMESKVSIGAGISTSLLLKSIHKYNATTTEIINNSLTYNEQSDVTSERSDFTTLDAGFLLSMGYMLKDGVELSGQSYWGLVDIKDANRKFKNRGFAISLSYRFKQL